MSRTTRGFLAAGLAALLVAAPLHALVLAGYARFWTPMVHAALCGWITALILAVNYHTLPVFSGRSFPYPRLLVLHLGVYGAGIVVALAGLIGGWQLVYAAGLGLELAAALVFVANTVLLFTRGARRGRPQPAAPAQAAVDRVGTRATKSAGVCLPVSLGLLLAVAVGGLDGAWLLAAEHLLTLGWIMLMIVGVAYHVLPRFSGRSTRGARWAAAQLGAQLLALVLIVAGLGFGVPATFALGGLVMAGALAAFGWTIWPTLVPVRTGPSKLTSKERRA